MLKGFYERERAVGRKRKPKLHWRLGTLAYTERVLTFM